MKADLIDPALKLHITLRKKKFKFCEKIIHRVMER